MARELECPVRFGELTPLGGQFAWEQRVVLSEDTLVFRGKVDKELGSSLGGFQKETRYFRDDRSLTVPLGEIDSIIVKPASGYWLLRARRATFDFTKVKPSESWERDATPGERMAKDLTNQAVTFFPSGKTGALFRQALASALPAPSRARSVKLMSIRAIAWSIAMLLLLPIMIVPLGGVILCGLALWTFWRLNEALRLVAGKRTVAGAIGLAVGWLLLAANVALSAYLLVTLD